MDWQRSKEITTYTKNIAKSNMNNWSAIRKLEPFATVYTYIYNYIARHLMVLPIHVNA